MLVMAAAASPYEIDEDNEEIELEAEKDNTDNEATTEDVELDNDDKVGGCFLLSK